METKQEIDFNLPKDRTKHIIKVIGVGGGGEELINVRASVVRNQQAPILLGQSVLGRLGKIEIDNEKRVLKVKK